MGPIEDESRLKAALMQYKLPNSYHNWPQIFVRMTYEYFHLTKKLVRIMAGAQPTFVNKLQYQ
jgi:hypothetical protein